MPSWGLKANRYPSADHGWATMASQALPNGLQVRIMNRGRAWWCKSLILAPQNQRQAALHELEGMSSKLNQIHTMRDSQEERRRRRKLYKQIP